RDGVSMTPLRDRLFGSQRTTLFVLFGAGVLLWAVALVNVLSLTFGDAISRRTATMTRLAFGARPADRARVAELIVLALAACVVSLGAAAVVLPVLYQIAPTVLTSIREAAVDWTVVGVALLLASIAAIGVSVPTATA